MFRFSLIVGAALILGITAKPYKPQNKLTDEAFQDTVMSIDDKGKMAWGVEVEPPEDMDETGYDIDPRMRIWKSMKGRGEDSQPLKAEEDLDELYHPSIPDLQEDANMKYNQEPEEDDIDPFFSVADSKEPEQDLDEVFHKEWEQVAVYPAPLGANYKAGAQVRSAYSEPEKDEDELYHQDVGSPVQMEPLGREVGGENEVRVHLQPEEDMDDLYHQDVPQLIPDHAEAAAPVDEQFQRKYSRPEEDLDHLYHQ